MNIYQKMYAKAKMKHGELSDQGEELKEHVQRNSSGFGIAKYAIIGAVVAGLIYVIVPTSEQLIVANEKYDKAMAMKEKAKDFIEKVRGKLSREEFVRLREKIAENQEIIQNTNLNDNTMINNVLVGVEVPIVFNEKKHIFKRLLNDADYLKLEKLVADNKNGVKNETEIAQLFSEFPTQSFSELEFIAYNINYALQKKYFIVD